MGMAMLVHVGVAEDVVLAVVRPGALCGAVGCWGLVCVCFSEGGEEEGNRRCARGIGEEGEVGG